jgi:predicted amidophosphoribosyltransferase
MSGRADRARNVQGAFRVTHSFLAEVAAARELAGLPIVLVDDVITTGATAAACATSFEAMGLRCVGVVSFARTPPRLPGV